MENNKLPPGFEQFFGTLKKPAKPQTKVVGSKMELAQKFLDIAKQFPKYEK
jgi:hypothetical protein